MKVIINDCHGGFGLSKEAEEYLGGYEFGTYEYGQNRDDPNLVRCVEELGVKANDHYSCLKVVEIPDDVEWHIAEHAGREWVAENHRTWS